MEKGKSHDSKLTHTMTPTGMVAAKIRSRKVEPYKGKGMLPGEQIRRKAGKTAAK